MSAFVSAVAARGSNHVETLSPIRGTGMVRRGSASIARVAAAACWVRVLSGCSKTSARSGRCNLRALSLSCLRMALSIALDDCPVALVWPRYLDTASVAESPSYQARRAASEAASGMATGVASSWELGLRLFFTGSSLAIQSSYCDKKDYHNSMIQKQNPQHVAMVGAQNE